MPSRWRYIIRKALKPKKSNSMHNSHIRWGHQRLDTSDNFQPSADSHIRWGHQRLDTSDNLLPSAALASAASINDNPSKASVSDDIDWSKKIQKEQLQRITDPIWRSDDPIDRLNKIQEEQLQRTT